MRLDQYVSEKLNISRNKAQAIIKTGNVFVNNKFIKKTWFEVKEDNIVEINELEETKYVARSAMKLKYFLDENNLELDWFNCLDIWSSTWWFCQILLEKWAKKIYAVDVWTSQLHEKIKNNNKIISIENTDIRKLEQLKVDLDLVTCDVSFISLGLIIDSIISHIWEKTIVLLLFKPQFEVWQKYINKKWVVTSVKMIESRMEDFLQLCKNKNLLVKKISESKLKWENWNKEIFIMITKK